jgi:hypothetical protein
MKIDFHSQHSFGYDIFYAGWKGLCRQKPYNALSGALDQLGYYPSFFTCHQIIAPSSGGNVTVTFTSVGQDSRVLVLSVNEEERLTLLGVVTSQLQETTFSTTTGMIYLILRVRYSSLISSSCDGCHDSCGILRGGNGTLSDESGPEDYPNNADCSWIIAPEGATDINITFTVFDLQEDFDFVHVYACESEQCTSPELVRELSGHISSSAEITLTAHSGWMLIRFTSNSIITRGGFTATWISSGSGSQTGGRNKIPVWQV